MTLHGICYMFGRHPRSASKPRSAEVRVALAAADEGPSSPKPHWGACARRRPASGTPPKASKASPAKTRKSKMAPRDAKVPTLLQERHAASLRDPSANGGPQWRQQGLRGNHLSNTTCLTHVFFKSCEKCSK